MCQKIIEMYQQVIGQLCNADDHSDDMFFWKVEFSVEDIMKRWQDIVEFTELR